MLLIMMEKIDAVGSGGSVYFSSPVTSRCIIISRRRKMLLLFHAYNSNVSQLIDRMI